MCWRPRAIEVSAASNGADALAMIAAAPPDLVLLDIAMPGLSGYDVCRQLRADPRHRAAAAGAVHLAGRPQERVKGIEAGADDFLAKPVNQAELYARCNRCCASRPCRTR
ncbi:MAG: response regulator [Ideonella sp.]|nr:response regulator [Ideonella sp.]